MNKNTNYTNCNYILKQLKLPLEIEKIIYINDSVYRFCDLMDHIDLSKYFAGVKGYKTGIPRCDAVKLLKVRLLAFMEKVKEKVFIRNNMHLTWTTLFLLWKNDMDYFVPLMEK